MATTYTLIKGETLASSAASYTFSAIPGTWTDLVVKASVRTDRAGENIDLLKLIINADVSSTYTARSIYGTSASAVSNSTSSNEFYFDFINGAASTSNTFANYELYIPSYTASRNKQMSSISVQENDSTVARINANANLFSSTASISSLQFSSYNAANLVAGSSFYLYGIKSS